MGKAKPSESVSNTRFSVAGMIEKMRFHTVADFIYGVFHMQISHYVIMNTS
jgi:hypothetical protein